MEKNSSKIKEQFSPDKVGGSRPQIKLAVREGKEEKMEKKRSIGLTVVGILCIIYSLADVFIPVLSVKEDYLFEYLIASFPKHLFFIAFCLIAVGKTAGFFIGGIGILRLKSWARKTVIIAAILGILSCILSGNIAGRYLVENKVVLFPELNIQLSDNLLFMLGFIASGFFSLFYLLCIFFFTRPKVKEQLK